MKTASRKTASTASRKPARAKAGKAKPTTRKKAPSKGGSAKTPRPKASSKGKAAADKPAKVKVEVDPDALEFIEALDRFKTQQGKPFPSWSEVLHVLKSLGYRKA